MPGVYAGHRMGSARVLRGVEGVHDAQMSAPTVQAESRLPRGVPRVLLVVVALIAAFTVGVLLWASGYGQGRPVNYEVLFALVFVVLALVPFAAMGALVVAAARKMRGTTAVVALGVVALGVVTVMFLLDFLASDSSTAALVFVVLPFYQLVLVAVTAAAAFGLHLVLRWRRARRLPPGGLGEEGAS